MLFESFHDMVNTKCVEEEICLCVVPFKKVQGVSAYLCVKCDKMLHSRHPKDTLKNTFFAPIHLPPTHNTMTYVSTILIVAI